MLLKEIFDHLAYGELNTIHLGEVDPATGELLPANQLKLLSHINAALYALYARFNLRTEKMRIVIREGKTRYELKPEFSGKTETNPRKYIEPVGIRFDHPLFKVLEVVTDKGQALSLNKVNDPNTVLTPQINVIEIPEGLKAETLLLTYKAGLPTLTELELDMGAELVDIPLPYAYLEALGYFVASRIMNPVGMQGQEMVQGTNYTMKYEAACMLLENSGMQIAEEREYNRARANGWV